MATENQRWLVVLEQWISSGSCFIIKTVTDKHRKDNKDMTNNDMPICMTEEYWKNSQFSIARYYGRMKINGHEFIIVNKDGIDVFTLSAIAEKQGKEKAIDPGEPCDLVRKDFVKYYRKLSRDAFLAVLKEYPTASAEDLKRIMSGISKRECP